MQINGSENMVFTAIVDGVEVQFDVLFSFESEETGKKYIAYTDNTRDREGNVCVYASTFEGSEETLCALKPIETEKEWALIDNLLKIIQQEIQRGKNTGPAEDGAETLEERLESLLEDAADDEPEAL